MGLYDYQQDIKYINKLIRKVPAKQSVESNRLVKGCVRAAAKMTCDWQLSLGLPIAVDGLAYVTQAHHSARIILRGPMVSESYWGNPIQ